MERLPGFYVRFVALLLFATLVTGASARASGTMEWPVVGPVVRGFDAPDSPYSSGHRGIDIAVPSGSPVLSPADGVVAFAGPIGGSLYVSVDHPGGVRSTFSWLSARAVSKGESVRVGQLLGYTGSGHPGGETAHLHLGMRVGDDYIDPLDLLLPLDLSLFLRLAPLPGPASV